MRGFLCFLLLLCCGVFSGCANIYYKIESDLQNTFSKQDVFSIHLTDSATISDKKLGILLGELMVDDGFMVSGFNLKQNARCHIAFSTKFFSHSQTGYYTTYNTQTTTTYTPGAFTNNAYNPGTTTTTTQIIPTNNTYSMSIYKKSIILIMRCQHESKSELAWSGIAMGNLKDVEKYKSNILKHFIKLFGKDFDGNIDMTSQ
ncbi:MULTISPECIES: hypothetical protein [unclassified Helicobacter]|nr:MULTISPECIES: hypothetical protein [unclassified Helicobacter]